MVDCEISMSHERHSVNIHQREKMIKAINFMLSNVPQFFKDIQWGGRGSVQTHPILIHFSPTGWGGQKSPLLRPLPMSLLSEEVSAMAQRADHVRRYHWPESLSPRAGGLSAWIGKGQTGSVSSSADHRCGERTAVYDCVPAWLCYRPWCRSFM